MPKSAVFSRICAGEKVPSANRIALPPKAGRVLCAEQTDTARALRHFPFACAAETVARRSLRAAKNGIGVVTPDAVSLLHRVAAKCLPQGLLMHLVGLWHRL